MDQGIPSMTFAEVAVNLPLGGTFTYRIPVALRGGIMVGQRVLVPFRSRRIVGVVVSLKETSPLQDVKDILRPLDSQPLLDLTILELLIWAARYYIYPPGKAIRYGLPAGRGRGSPLEDKPGPERGSWDDPKGPPDSFVAPKILKVVALSPSQEAPCANASAKDLGPVQQGILRELKEKGEVPLVELERIYPSARSSIRALQRRHLVILKDREVMRDPLIHEDLPPEPSIRLTLHQERALAAIREGLLKGGFRSYLLHGVTGSGKTEVYLRASEVTIARGRGVLILVPEISLTHEIVRRFRARFGSRVAVLHSRLSKGERWDTWRMLRSSRADVVVGARSAIFAPLNKVGLIVVDEEHDTAYKQEDDLRYNARDLALVRGKLEEAVVVMGSATPSLESFFNGMRGRFEVLQLPTRLNDRPLPQVMVVDMRDEMRGAEGETASRRRPILSPPLRDAIQENLARGEQTVLFLNRRGFATFILCRDCGHRFMCPNCSVALVYHLSEGALMCHYCNHRQKAPAACPSCGGGDVRELGIGTELLEEEVKGLFPQARIIRMDRDTASRKWAPRELLSIWRRGEADILIGTQMITKGHHIPHVTLVGVVLADISLNIPDFRSSERTFQLLTQVAGRAGRGERPGRVIIQTFNPDHYSIRCAASHDYMGFVKEELILRREAGYPPYTYLVNIVVSGPDAERVTSMVSCLAEVGERFISSSGYVKEGLQCLGPAPTPISRLKGRYRWHLLLKARSREGLHALARELLHSFQASRERKGLRISVDVDPQSFL